MPIFLSRMEPEVVVALGKRQPYWLVASIHDALLPGEEVDETKSERIYQKMEKCIKPCAEAIAKKLNAERQPTAEVMAARMAAGEKLYQAYLEEVKATEVFATYLHEQYGALRGKAALQTAGVELRSL